MAPININLDFAPIIKPLGAGISHLGEFLGASILDRNAIRRAQRETWVDLIEDRGRDLLQGQYDAGIPLPGALSKLSEGRDTLRIEAISTRIAEDRIRQEAISEAQKEFIEQLREKLVVAFNNGNYEASLSIVEILQKYIITNSEIYIVLENIRVSSLAEIFFSETGPEKKCEYYKQLSDYIEEHFVTCDFSTLFKYGLANLYMLPIVESQEEFLFIERAKKSFEKALIFNQDIDFTLTNLAVAIQYSERNANTSEESTQILQTAIHHLEEAKKIAPQNHKIFSNLGDIYMRLAEISSVDVTQQTNFLRLSMQAYSACLAISRSFPLIMRKANAIFSLGKIEQNIEAKDRLLQDAISFYNDAYIIAPSRTDAAYACLKTAQVYDTGRRIAVLPQEQKDSLIFLGLRCYMTALEHAPFYSDLQYVTAQLILNIAKFGEQDIPSFKKNVLPQVATVVPSKKGKLNAEQVKQVRQATEQAMMQVKTNFLSSSERYFRDAVYLMPENPQAAVGYVEFSVYWAFLQKRQGNQQKAEVELNSVAQLLDKADQLKSSSASYVRACLHAVKDDAELCQSRLKEAVENNTCPPRSQVSREPYFSGYTKTRWFKEILKIIPDRPVSDLYSTIAPVFAGSGASS